MIHQNYLFFCLALFVTLLDGVKLDVTQDSSNVSELISLSTQTIQDTTTTQEHAPTELSTQKMMKLESRLMIPKTILNATHLKDMAIKRSERYILYVNPTETVSNSTGSGLSRRQQKRRKRRKAKNLLYEERSPTGEVTQSVPMKDLDDVANFFNQYLETEICHVVCDSVEVI